MGGLFSSPDISGLESTQNDLLTWKAQVTNNLNNLQANQDQLSSWKTQTTSDISKLQQSILQLGNTYSSTPIGPTSLYYINPFTNARRIHPKLAIQEPTQSCLSKDEPGQYLLYGPESKLNQIMALSSSQILFILTESPNDIVPYVYKLTDVSNRSPVLERLSSVTSSGDEVFEPVSSDSSEYKEILSILQTNYYGYILQSCSETFTPKPPRFLATNASTPVFRKAVIGRTHRYA